MAQPPSAFYTPMDLAGTAVLITGATAGIGQAAAWRFAELNCRVALAGRRTERLESLKAEIVKRFPSCPEPIVVTVDVADAAAVKELPQFLEKAGMAELDILVNNAGLSLTVSPADENDMGDVQTMFATNVLGVMGLVSAFAGGMRKRGRGHIVNVSSIAGHEYYSGGSAYAATKHAVNAFTICARHDLVGTPVRVTAISPGMVDTEFSAVRFRGDMEKVAKFYENIVPMNAEDVADQIIYATTRPRHVQVADIISYPTNQAHCKYALERVGPSLGAPA